MIRLKYSLILLIFFKASWTSELEKEQTEGFFTQLRLPQKAFLGMQAQAHTLETPEENSVEDFSRRLNLPTKMLRKGKTHKLPRPLERFFIHQEDPETARQLKESLVQQSSTRMLSVPGLKESFYYPYIIHVRDPVDVNVLEDRLVFSESCTVEKNLKRYIIYLCPKDKAPQNGCENSPAYINDIRESSFSFPMNMYRMRLDYQNPYGLFRDSCKPMYKLTSKISSRAHEGQWYAHKITWGRKVVFHFRQAAENLEAYIAQPNTIKVSFEPVQRDSDGCLFSLDLSDQSSSSLNLDHLDNQSSSSDN